MSRYKIVTKDDARRYGCAALTKATPDFWATVIERVVPATPDSAIVVTSERYNANDGRPITRRYTVWSFDTAGHVYQLSAPQEFPTVSRAGRWALARAVAAGKARWRSI